MDIDELQGSEFSNNADLMGINTDSATELLGKLNRSPKEKVAAFFKKAFKRPSFKLGSNSRDEFEEKFDQLPKDIQQGLLKKRLQLTDTRFYRVAEISNIQSIDIFQGTDNKNVGLGNIASQKLEKDNWFILSAIRLTYGEGLNRNVALYGELPAVILNGEFELEAAQKKIFGLTENSLFDTKGRTDIPSGYYKLHSTKLIEPQAEIKMPIKFSAATGANAFLKVTLIGSSVVPY
jgi:hypothetical protein